MRGKWAVTIIISIACLLAGLATYHSFSPSKADAAGFSEFTLPDVDGIERSSSEWQGRILLINFWATWCPPCLKEIPGFIALQNRYGSKGVQIVGIAMDDKEPVVEFVERHGINYPILIGDKGGARLSLNLGNNIQALPYSVVVNRDGLIIHKQNGLFSKQRVVDIITPLLAKSV